MQLVARQSVHAALFWLGGMHGPLNVGPMHLSTVHRTVSEKQVAQPSERPGPASPLVPSMMQPFTFVRSVMFCTPQVLAMPETSVVVTMPRSAALVQAPPIEPLLLLLDDEDEVPDDEELDDDEEPDDDDDDDDDDDAGAAAAVAGGVGAAGEEGEGSEKRGNDKDMTTHGGRSFRCAGADDAAPGIESSVDGHASATFARTWGVGRYVAWRVSERAWR